MSCCNLRSHSERRFCCGGCGTAFSSMAVFDWHRRGGHCTHPSMALTFGIVGDPLFVSREIPGEVGTVTIWGQPGGGRWDAS